MEKELREQLVEFFYRKFLIRTATQSEVEKMAERLGEQDVMSLLDRLWLEFSRSAEFKIKYRKFILENFDHIENDEEATKQMQPPVLRSSIFENKKFYLVHLPSMGWMTYCIQISNYLREREQCYLGLVIDEKFIDIPARELLLSLPSIDFLVGVKWAQKNTDALSNIPINYLVHHAWGWNDDIASLKAKLKSCQSVIYADGYKNWVPPSSKTLHKPESQIYFGHVDSVCTDQTEVIRLENRLYREASLTLSTLYGEFSLKEPSNYYVVCIRYWGIGPYQFKSSASLVPIIVNTIKKHLPDSSAGTTIVIKNDPRCQHIDLVELAAQISALGFTCVNLENIVQGPASLRTAAMEVFWAKGFLCDAKGYFVFDSSLSLIANFFHKTGDYKIFIGADPESILDAAQEQCIEEIRVNVSTYSALIREYAERESFDVCVDSHSSGLFSVVTACRSLGQCPDI